MLKSIPPIFSLILIAIAAWFTFFSSQPGNITSENIPETGFSTQRAFQHVEAMAQQPHYIGTAEHSRVRNYIVNELQKMDLLVQTQEDYTLNKNGSLVRPQNILSRIEGDGDGQALVLMSHYDSNPHSSLGASDAASGVATILEGIRAFLAQNKSHENDIILLFTDAEEVGLNGAELFVKDHPWTQDAALVLNFEARGSGGDSFMFLETNSGNAKLVKAFQEANPEYPVTNSLVYSIYKMLPNDTDLTVLREQANIQGFNFAFIDDHFDYHTATDTPENLDKESLAHQGSYLMPLLETFKSADLSNFQTEKELIFFSLPGGEMISYPFSWITPMLLIAVVIFILLLVYGFSRKSLESRSVFKGFLAFLLSSTISGLLVYLLWKFNLYIYPEYSEMEQGFTYNGYYYIAAFLFLSLTVAFFTYHRYHKNTNKASLLVFPLFFWILLCSLLAFYLKGAAYFIIPVYFGLLQLFVMIRQEKPNNLLMAFLSLPAIAIFLPLLVQFPVALGLKILFASALLCFLLFTLMLPVFAYFKRKKALAVLSFLIFNILFFTAHFKSKFDEESPKPNSLVYLFDADENTAHWRSYDEMPDEWTENFFGKEPVIIPSNEKTFSSKYGSNFTWRAEAPSINLEAPAILFDSLGTTDEITHYSLKIAPNRKIHRLELFADRSMDFEKFTVNGLQADDTRLGDNKFNVHTRRWHDRLLTWHVSGRDTLRLEFSLESDKKPAFTLYESSFDLLENQELNVPKRSESMIPRPFVVNDAVIFKKTISPE
ncbi:M20/M25/M40 family metallo-hydrolase [Salegentibacter sediminis]|uniref:M20/M25/M40 family metallo-hydrolase n=1 Tax=Salegentibacter sediminis TaxID=1930251 RepID=UPI0009BF8A53|nr:M20/M25/M40 family metallo-hydrolase [Salegentibacter sediminis]